MYRIVYDCEHLTKDDFYPRDKSSITENHKFGFGINYDHYRKVKKAREQLNLPVHEIEQYDNRTGYYIDGRKIDTKIHPLHDKTLIYKNKKYVIDTVSIQHYYGKYLQISCRQFGSQSHSTFILKNYTCKDDTILDSLITDYELVDKIEYLESVDDIYDWFKMYDYLFEYNSIKNEFKYIHNDITCKIKNNRVYLNDIEMIIEKYEDLIKIKKHCQNF